MNSFQRKLKRALELGPRLVLAEIQRRSGHALSLRWRRLRAAVRPPTLSGRQLEALLPNLSRSEWLEHFTTRTAPVIFPGVSDLPKTAKLVREHCPNAVAATIRTAEAACEHRFFYFSHEFAHSLTEIDWLSGWPQAHYTAIVYGAGRVPPKDIKLTWELGRFQHANALGRAYALTGEARFAEAFWSQLESFDRQNPCEFGPHWLCAMEVAIRAVNLCLAFYFFKDAPGLNSERLARLLRMLAEHGRFIEANLENSHHVTSNHYLSDLVGLLFLGVLFPEFSRSQAWREMAWREILVELDKQVYPEGANYEASISYHRLVTELFLYALELGESNGLEVPPFARERLSAMFDFVRHYLKPDGHAPQIGDTDNGQLVVWAERQPTDHSYLLALAGSVFRASEVGFREPGRNPVAESETEAIWFRGNLPADTAEPPFSKAFAETGIYLLRDRDDYLVVDCGDNGIGGHGSHGHNDALGIEVFTAGRTWLVDPGTYTYTGDLEARDRFRSTAYHTTARVDGAEINPIVKGTPFALGSNVKPRVTVWKSSPTEDMLEAEHDGFMRLSHGVTHQRKIVFAKPNREWIVEDRFIGTDSEVEHTIELFFNFDLGIELVRVTPREIKAKDEAGREFFIQLVHASAPIQAESTERWVSQGYGQRAASVGAKWEIRRRIPVIVTWRVFGKR
ncbi:MAG: heparinase II/III family protein [Blastocatellia bacterium]|nr:heparinase II/III family protein [Blastocatellia bacterium]